MKHTQTATVREMRTLTNTCQKHAADAAEHLKVCQRLSEVTCDNAVRADHAADRAEHADRSATNAAWRADCSVHDAQDAAKAAEQAAKHTAKDKLIIIIVLLVSIIINAAINSFHP